jgi:hypothetical protein
VQTARRGFDLGKFGHLFSLRQPGRCPKMHFNTWKAAEKCGPQQTVALAGVTHGNAQTQAAAGRF